MDNNTGFTEAQGGTLVAGQVSLRADKRPRPIVLRANIGDCQEIRFTNLLNPIAIAGQPADRTAGIHVNGLEPVNSINDDGSFVGLNPPPGNGSGLVAPGQTTTYRLYAQYENTFLLYNMGGTAGGEGGSGTLSYGLFGAVNVEPSDSTNGSAATWQSEWYRSQLTRVEMDWAASAWACTLCDGTDWTPSAGNLPTGPLRTTPDGQPILNYDAVYPTGAPYGKAGLPIINLLAPKTGYAGEIVHSDINVHHHRPGAQRFPRWLLQSQRPL